MTSSLALLVMKKLKHKKDQLMHAGCSNCMSNNSDDRFAVRFNEHRAAHLYKTSILINFG